MASEVPLVRFFVACRAVIADPGRKKYTLQDLIHAVVRLPGEPFPCIRTEMALFALLTNGRGGLLCDAQRIAEAPVDVW
jgi:hypothetical protein